MVCCNWRNESTFARRNRNVVKNESWVDERKEHWILGKEGTEEHLQLENQVSKEGNNDKNKTIT